MAAATGQLFSVIGSADFWKRPRRQRAWEGTEPISKQGPNQQEPALLSAQTGTGLAVATGLKALVSREEVRVQRMWGAGVLLIRAEVQRVKKGQQQGSRATGQWRRQTSGHLRPGVGEVWRTVRWVGGTWKNERWQQNMGFQSWGEWFQAVTGSVIEAFFLDSFCLGPIRHLAH